MVITMMSASFFVFILAVIIQRNSEASPMRDYDGVPSGVLRPISGVVPISAPRRRLDAVGKVLRAIRNRVDKSLIEELDSSTRNDIMQDALTPPECFDHYGIRDGIFKHTIRGVRDIVEALIRDFQGLGKGVIKNLPLAPNVINGVGEAITYIICGVEDAASDIISGFNDGPEILTRVIVEFLELEGSSPLANIPVGIVNITRLAEKIESYWVLFLGAKVIHDVVLGIEEGVDDLAEEVGSGVRDVVTDVETVVSGVETEVTDVVNAVESGVQMIGGGVGHGVNSIVTGVKGAVGGLLAALG